MSRVYTAEQKARRLEMQRKRLAENPEARAKANAASLAWSKANKAHKAAYDKAKREENPDKYSDRYRAYYLRNKDRRNLDIRASNAARKERIKRQGIAKSYADEVRVIYKNCPSGFHVDHIVPLRGATVSGLHVPWNLQYLPAKDNLKKGAKWDSL